VAAYTLTKGRYTVGLEQCEPDDPDAIEDEDVKKCFETMFIACVKGASAYTKLRDSLRADEPLINIISLTADKQREIMSLIDSSGERLHRALAEVGSIMGEECQETIISGLYHYAGEAEFKRYINQTKEDE